MRQIHFHIPFQKTFFKTSIFPRLTKMRRITQHRWSNFFFFSANSWKFSRNESQCFHRNYFKTRIKKRTIGEKERWWMFNQKKIGTPQNGEKLMRGGMGKSTGTPSFWRNTFFLPQDKIPSLPSSFEILPFRDSNFSLNFLPSLKKSY